MSVSEDAMAVDRPAARAAKTDSIHIKPEQIRDMMLATGVLAHTRRIAGGVVEILDARELTALARIPDGFKFSLTCDSNGLFKYGYEMEELEIDDAASANTQLRHALAKEKKALEAERAEHQRTKAAHERERGERLAAKEALALLSTNFDCKACYETVHRVIMTPCGHGPFHAHCLYKWIEGVQDVVEAPPHNTCPGCRRVIMQSPLLMFDLQPEGLPLHEDPDTDAFLLWLDTAVWPKVIAPLPEFVRAAAAPDDPRDPDYRLSDDEEMDEEVIEGSVDEEVEL